VSYPNLEVTTETIFEPEEAFFNEDISGWFCSFNTPRVTYKGVNGNCIGGEPYDPSSQDEDLFNTLNSLGLFQGIRPEGIFTNVNFISHSSMEYCININANAVGCFNGVVESPFRLFVRAANGLINDDEFITYNGFPSVPTGTTSQSIGSVVDDPISPTDYYFPFLPNNNYSQLQLYNAIGDPNGDSDLSINNVSVTCTTSALTEFQSQVSGGNVQFEAINEFTDIPFVKYKWNFGDGNLSEEAEPNHTYENSGSYNVCIDIVNEFGCCGSFCEKIEVTLIECGGPHVLTGINQVSDLVSLLELNGPDELSSANAIVEIDGVLEIDENSITFGDKLNFLLTTGSSIVVNSSNQLVKNGGFIGPCGINFVGVIVNDGANLDISGVRIWGAEAAVNLSANSILNSTSCTLEDSGYGVYINGQATIPTFIGNTIKNCDFGINAENTLELNITEQNDFISCGMGIRYWKTGGGISNNNFQECNFGIFLHKSSTGATVENNTINAMETGIVVKKYIENVRISQNDIGGSSDLPNYGIYTENSSISIEDNISIKAKYRGIAVYSPIRLYVTDNELIQVNSNSWNGSGSYGIYVLNDNDGSISGNNIFGYMENNIFCLSCDETFIAGSENLSGATGHSIVMQGGVGATISSNHILTEPIKGIGLYSHTGASILYNSIRAQNTGLYINDLSQTQSIGCNDFQEGNKDIVTRAVLGWQYHHDNQFRKIGSRAFTEGLFPGEVQQSVFFVDNCAAASSTCEHPELWFRPELFEMVDFGPEFPSDFPTDCGDNGDGSEPNDPGITPPNPGPGDDYWCWLFSQFESTQNTNPLKSWVLRYKALKLNSLKPDRMIPEDCIPDNDFYCNINEFIDIESSVKNLRKNVGLGNISYEMMELGIQNRIADLDILDCNNYIFRLYRNIYRTLLKDMIEEELNSDEIVELRDAADLCAYMYGDVVYWARGILDHRGETTKYDDVTCENDWSEYPKSRNEKAFMNNQILVSPNPASNYITIENKTSFEVLQVKMTDSFGRIYEISEDLENQLKIDCSTYSSGVYFITITNSSGYLRVKKVIVTN